MSIDGEKIGWTAVGTILTGLGTGLGAWWDRRRKAKAEDAEQRRKDEEAEEAEEESEFRRLERLCDRLQAIAEKAFEQRDRAEARHAEMQALHAQTQAALAELSTKHSILTRESTEKIAALSAHVEALEAKVECLIRLKEEVQEESRAREQRINELRARLRATESEREEWRLKYEAVLLPTIAAETVAETIEEI